MSDSLDLPAFDLGEPPAPAKSDAYRVLARKYRPQTFAELIGQDAMVTTLGNAIRRGRLAHAFLLTGVRGVGKTTTARLVARYLKAFGILPTGVFKEVNGLHLKGQYVGQTSHHVSEIVKDALGGCLFIDEACKVCE